jgi:hypothetical protein
MLSGVKSWQRNALFFLTAAICVLFYITRVDSGFPLDDAWIHQVYGRNLAETGQWAFVPGVPSAASTSPLYTVLLSMGYRLDIPYPLWTHMLGVLALALTGLVGARMAERLLPDHKSIGLIAGLTLIFSWHLIWAAASGMETMFFSLMTLLLPYLLWRELETRSQSVFPVILRGAIFGAFSALATLTRPEGIILVGLCGLSMLILRPQGLKPFFLWVIGVAIGFGLLIWPYLSLNLQLTGGLLPNTASAKQAEYAPLLALPYPARLNMIYPIIAGAQFLLIPGMVAFAGMTIRTSRLDLRKVFYLLLLLWPLVLIGLYAARLPAPYQHGRYVIPALPSLILTGVVGTVYLLHWGKRSVMGRVLPRTLVIAAAITLIYFAFVAGAAAYRTGVNIINEEMVASARWIHDNIPPEELLVVHDIGAVGYFAPRPILDLAGLVSPEVVPIILDSDALWLLMFERDTRYLLAFPDQIPGKNVRDPRLCPVFTTGGTTSPRAGGANMTIYSLTWGEACPENQGNLSTFVVQ